MGASTQMTARGEGITAMLKPRSIAVIGASATQRAYANGAFTNLKNAGFGGTIVAVHPTAEEIDGVPAVATPADLTSDLDVALVSVPAKRLMTTLQELERAGCKSAVVLSAGFDWQLRQTFTEFARASVMAIHGPNSMGIVNVTDRIPLWCNTAALPLGEPGSVGLIAQSGSAAGMVPRAAGPARFSKIIASGDELGLGSGEYMSWFANDPATKVVALVIESISGGADAFASGVQELRAAGKPVVVLKVGSSEVGSAASMAHTGALVGTTEAYKALFRDLDVPTVADYDELGTTLECLIQDTLRPARGPRVGVVTISGGQAALAADLAERVEVPLASLSEQTVADIETHLPGLTGFNPLDAGALVGMTADDLRDSIVRMGEAPEVHSMMVVLDAADTIGESEVDFELPFLDAAKRAAATLDKPLVVASSSSLAIHPRFLEAAGPDLPIVRGIGNTLVALKAISANQLDVRLASGTELEPELEALRAEIAASSGPLSFELGRRLLERYGLPVVGSALVDNADEGAKWAEEIGYPVVVKVASTLIPHRTEVGGVITDVQDAAGLRDAVATIGRNVAAACPGVSIEGFEVQKQIVGGVEAVIGSVSHPGPGPMVVVGMGGSLVELIRDREYARAPVDVPHAQSLVDQSRLGALLGGYRELIPETDSAPMAAAVHALSRLAADFAQELSESDLNPVLIEPGTGAVHVVDALFVAREADAGPPPGAHTTTTAAAQS